MSLGRAPITRTCRVDRADLPINRLLFMLAWYSVNDLLAPTYVVNRLVYVTRCIEGDCVACTSVSGGDRVMNLDSGSLLSRESRAFIHYNLL